MEQLENNGREYRLEPNKLVCQALCRVQSSSLEGDAVCEYDIRIYSLRTLDSDGQIHSQILSFKTSITVLWEWLGFIAAQVGLAMVFLVTIVSSR